MTQFLIGMGAVISLMIGIVAFTLAFYRWWQFAALVVLSALCFAAYLMGDILVRVL